MKEKCIPRRPLRDAFFTLLLLLKGIALCLAACGGVACTYVDSLSLAVLVLVVDAACYVTLNLCILAGTSVNAGTALERTHLIGKASAVGFTALASTVTIFIDLDVVS